MLAEDGGELVVFSLLIISGDRVKVSERILVFADLVRLDSILENAVWREIQLVGVAPDGEAGGNIGSVFETFKKRISGEVLFVVAVGDNVTLVS